ncbi:Hypothetical predicted protein, partial [Drosophila guanche]
SEASVLSSSAHPSSAPSTYIYGLRSKLSTLFMESFTFSSHVIVFTETWLKPDIISSEVLADR